MEIGEILRSYEFSDVLNDRLRLQLNRDVASHTEIKVKKQTWNAMFRQTNAIEGQVWNQLWRVSGVNIL